MPTDNNPNQPNSPINPRKKSGIPFIGGSAYLNNAKFLDETGAQERDALTFGKLSQQTLSTFVALVLGCVGGWIAVAQYPQVGSGLMMGALVAALILGIVNSVKREVVPALVLAWGVAEGVCVGALSYIYQTAYDGIVLQAVLATIVVCGCSCLLLSTGIVKAHMATFAKFIIVALLSYLVFTLLSLVLSFAGVISYADIYFNSPLGLAISAFAILLGGLMLTMDLTRAQQAIAERLPAKQGWRLAFAITLDVVWIYLEVLRLIAISRR